MAGVGISAQITSGLTFRTTNIYHINTQSKKLHNSIRTSRLVFTARLCPQFWMLPSFDRCTPPRRRFNQNIPPSVVLLQQCHCRNRHRAKLQNLSPPSVLFESSRIFFHNTQETQTQKMMDQNFEIRILWFLRIFLKFLKRHRTVPSAADLDHYGRGQTRSE